MRPDVSVEDTVNRVCVASDRICGCNDILFPFDVIINTFQLYFLVRVFNEIFLYFLYKSAFILDWDRKLCYTIFV